MQPVQLLRENSDTGFRTCARLLRPVRFLAGLVWHATCWRDLTKKRQECIYHAAAKTGLLRWRSAVHRYYPGSRRYTLAGRNPTFWWARACGEKFSEREREHARAWVSECLLGGSVWAESWRSQDNIHTLPGTHGDNIPDGEHGYKETLSSP